jgi:hypothetical protein
MSVETTRLIRELLEEADPVANAILEDVGCYTMLELPFHALYRKHGKTLSNRTLAKIGLKVWFTDDRVINLMSTRTDFIKTKAILKTDFSYLVADVLGVGRNKGIEIVESFIDTGEFALLTNVIANNAKLVRPTFYPEFALVEMKQAIEELTGQPMSEDEAKNFMEEA